LYPWGLTNVSANPRRYYLSLPITTEHTECTHLGSW
jgi:hypothetical protein